MTSKLSKHLITLTLASVLSLTACSGGGSSPSPTPTPTGSTPTSPTPTTPTPTPLQPVSSWTENVYEPASIFRNRCETPRSGRDIAGNVFPDIAGTQIDEKMYLRSWVDETYLWFDEVADRNPNIVETVISYFDQLKTNEILPSGKPKDEFHFTTSTEEDLADRLSAASASYGASYGRVLTPGMPNRARILYNQEGTPSAEIVDGQVQLKRGTEILGANGIRIDNLNVTSEQYNAYIDALYPDEPNITSTFTIREAGETQTREITITSTDVVTTAVNKSQTIDTTTGKVGYLLLNTFGVFEAETQLYTAFNTFASENVSDLVVDLRYNGGGFIDIASQMSYMIAGDTNTDGKNFSITRFNDKSGNLNPVTGAVNTPSPFHSTTLGFSETLPANTPLSSLDLNRVYILSTSNTCSASELIINSLRGIDVEVILIGPEPTCGKPFGFYSRDNCGTTYYAVQFQSVNDKGFGSYESGFVPNDNSSAPFAVQVSGCTAADDVLSELGNTNEDMLETALYYRENGVCSPPPSSTNIRSAPKTRHEANNTPAKLMFENTTEELKNTVAIINSRG